jgi:virginiamycin B lyase
MEVSMRKAPVLLLAAVVLGTLPGTVVAQETEIQEWVVPWEQSRPRDLHVGPDGKVWFVGQRTSYAAYLDRHTGEFKKFDLDEGTGPHTLIVDDDGTVWYTGNRAQHIGRLDPVTGEIHKYMLPDGVRDPHTMVFDDKGGMWFTVQSGNYIGYIDKATGETEIIAAPEVEGGRSSSSRPYGIKMDSQGRPWIALFNTNMIATVDPETMELRTFELPENALPRRLVITSDDMIWYGDYRRGYTGRLNPETGEVTEWANPSGQQSRPYGMAVDKDDRIWFVETGVQPNRFVGFDPETQTFISNTEVASGGGSVRHMFYEESTNTIWFGTDANTIGGAKLPPKERITS